MTAFLALPLLLLLAACGPNYDHTRKDLAQGSVALSESSTLSYLYVPPHLRTDPKTIGAITLTHGNDDARTRDTSVLIRRIPHGYAAETPLSDKDFPLYLSVGKDRERDYFTGIRFRIQF